MSKVLKLTIAILLTLTVAGCARSPNKTDPYETYNRFMYAVNTDLDHLIFRPFAVLYQGITPPPLQKGITNVFDNIETVTTIPNDILQGKIQYAFSDTLRLIINTVFGIGGLFDVATRLGIPKHYEDFGMTLAYWDGGKKSPYLVLPILGPRTFRAGFGNIFDYAMSPWPYVKPREIRYYGFGLKLLSIRSGLLPADKLIDSSFDPYAFVRNAYLQKRNQMIARNEVNLTPADAKKTQENGGAFAPEPPPNIGNDNTTTPKTKTKAANRKTEQTTPKITYRIISNKKLVS